MVSSGDRFGQARLKHIWANQRINEAHALWQDFLQSDFCKLRVEPHPDHAGDVLRIRAIEPIPAEIVMSIGDAIHNLKASLDYVISELLGWKDTRLTFPMGETREELVTSFSANGLPACPTCGRGGKGKGRNAAIEMAVPGISAIIADEVRPYKAADGYIWPLNKLDVRDKHRMIVPVVVPMTMSGINAIDDNNNRWRNASGTFHGAVLSLIGSDSRLKIESYGKPSAEIFFNEVGIIENKRVFPTLLNMSQAVSQTIGRIEEFAVSVGWTNPSR